MISRKLAVTAAALAFGGGVVLSLGAKPAEANDGARIFNQILGAVALNICIDEKKKSGEARAAARYLLETQFPAGTELSPPELKKLENDAAAGVCSDELGLPLNDSISIGNVVIPFNLLSGGHHRQDRYYRDDYEAVPPAVVMPRGYGGQRYYDDGEERRRRLEWLQWQRQQRIEVYRDQQYRQQLENQYRLREIWRRNRSFEANPRRLHPDGPQQGWHYRRQFEQPRARTWQPPRIQREIRTPRSLHRNGPVQGQRRHRP